MSFKFGYHQIKRVGGGNFSDVYKVEDDPNSPIDRHRVYAMKVVEPDSERKPHNVRNEASIMLKMKRHDGTEKYSPNIIRLLKEFTNPLEIGLLFPFYEATLIDVIRYRSKKHVKFSGGAIKRVVRNGLTGSQIKHILSGLLGGLSFVHGCGIIHRDINPNNILFKHASSLDPVIIDFGISFDKPNNNGLEPRSQMITDIATGYYKAPELLLSISSYGNGVDLWSMGIIISLLCSSEGKVPFDEDAAHSDLALLSNIVAVFGSPPKDWEDCQGSRSFEAMNDSFFSRKPWSIAKALPQISGDSTCDGIADIFRGLTRYTSRLRMPASQALQILTHGTH